MALRVVAVFHALGTCFGDSSTAGEEAGLASITISSPGYGEHVSGHTWIAKLYDEEAASADALPRHFGKQKVFGTEDQVWGPSQLNGLSVEEGTKLELELWRNECDAHWLFSRLICQFRGNGFAKVASFVVPATSGTATPERLTGPEDLEVDVGFEDVPAAPAATDDVSVDEPAEEVELEYYYTYEVDWPVVGIVTGSIVASIILSGVAMLMVNRRRAKLSPPTELVSIQLPLA